MRSKGFEGMACSIAEVLQAIGDRWAALILRDLLIGLSRYDDLQRSTGATNATLAARLKDLEHAGLLERRRYQTRPDRYEYVLTEKGYDLSLLMMALVQIGDKWRKSRDQAPPLRFVDRRSGQDVKLALRASTTHAVDDDLSLAIEAGPGADDLMSWRIAQGADQRRRRRSERAVKS